MSRPNSKYDIILFTIAIPNVQPFSVGKAPTGEVRHEHASNGIAIAAQPFPHPAIAKWGGMK